MTRSPILVAAAGLFVCLAACGSGTDQPDAQADPNGTELTTDGMPDDDVHARAMSEAMGGSDHSMGINRQVNLPEEIRSAWRGVSIRVVDTTTGVAETFEVELGSTASLGNSGLSLLAETFIPAFVMDDGGITSSSAEPTNPAVHVVITEEAQEPYHGWLFATMPEIHPFPHDRYQVLLVEGIPSE